MKIEKLILGEFKTNCYVISHNNTAFVIDPACNGETIEAFINKNNYQLMAIFLTHGHQDHIGAVDHLYNRFHCPIYAHKNEIDILTNCVASKMIYNPFFEGIKVNSPINYFEGDFNSFNILDITIDAILTPGHTEGSTTYVLRNYNRIFSGDTVFKNSVGRTDFPTSNANDLKSSIEIFKHFKEECKIHPGHGESTTVKNEKENNQFFKY